MEQYLGDIAGNQVAGVILEIKADCFFFIEIFGNGFLYVLNCLIEFIGEFILIFYASLNQEASKNFHK